MPNVNRANLYFDYDGMGNRIRKRVVRNPASNQVATTTWYARDPQGNVMAVYRTRQDTTWLVEHHLYGADRLGICEVEQVMDTPQDDTDPDEGDGPAKKTNNNSLPPKAEVSPKNAYFRLKGCREYELKNHLGNVLAVVSDLKLGMDSLVNGKADFYLAEVRSLSDYYPFGSEMPGRAYASGDFRYGFNGKEKDDEWQGSGNSNNTFFRQYSSRIGRWMSIDPKQNWSESSYVGIGNNPIQFFDRFGDTTYVYSYAGKYLGIINDNLENQIHFISEFQVQNYSKYLNIVNDKFEGADLDEISSYVRDNSAAFIGANTYEAMEQFYENTSRGTKIETGGFLFISDSRELLPWECDECETNITSTGSTINIGQFNEDKDWDVVKDKYTWFTGWHTHPSLYDRDGQISPSGKRRGDDNSGDIEEGGKLGAKSPLLKNMIGGPGVLFSQYGITLYRHKGYRNNEMVQPHVQKDGPEWSAKQRHWPLYKKSFFIKNK